MPMKRNLLILQIVMVVANSVGNVHGMDNVVPVQRIVWRLRRAVGYTCVPEKGGL